MLPKIFDLFVQAHHTIDRTRGGLGIGLTLVRRLAELHGGTVHAASDGDGRGSTFTVRLPTVAAPAVQSARRPRTTARRQIRRSVRIAARAAGGRQPRLTRDVPRRAAARTATTSARRRTASTRWRCSSSAAGPLDVAFIDIGLPGGMDGYELARRIRSHPAGANMRLVALTGYGFPEDRHAVDAGRIRAAPREAGRTRGAAPRIVRGAAPSLAGSSYRSRRRTPIAVAPLSVMKNV